MNKEDVVVFHIMDLSQKLIKLSTKNLQTTGLGFPEAKLMMEIHKHEPISQIELAKILHITPATLSTRLKRLEKMDMIQRIQNEKDTRKYNVMLTEKSNSYIRETDQIFNELTMNVQNGLTPEEIQKFIEISNKIRMNIGGMQDE